MDKAPILTDEELRECWFKTEHRLGFPNAVIDAEDFEHERDIAKVQLDRCDLHYQQQHKAEMEQKDKQIELAYKQGKLERFDSFPDLKRQIDESRQEGRKEVVEGMKQYVTVDGDVHFFEEDWQAKLKEWGI